MVLGAVFLKQGRAAAIYGGPTGLDGTLRIFAAFRAGPVAGPYRGSGKASAFFHTMGEICGVRPAEDAAPI